MPFAEVADLRIHYTDAGEGEPLVFLHGFTLDHRMWKRQIDHFRGNYRVVCPDSRGHGLSAVPPTGYSRDHRVEELRELADKIELERFHLIGLSMGGSTAIGFALKHQERLRSLILVSSGAAGYSVGKKISKIDQLAIEKGLEAARARWMHWSLRYYRNRNEDLGRELEIMMREHPGAVWLDKMRGKYPRTYDLDHIHRIGVPTLIMAGQSDTMFIELARQLHAGIAGSSMVIYKKTGHMINLEIPERFNSDIERFIESVSSA
ncbi:MAG: alpha/beta hydrolase [Candidatus Zixiibacteriota bacterium]|nr:MAG: alpha/beta hydrolase [candidate division Zixibacteria bacterium]